MNDAFHHARVIAVTLLNLQPIRTPEAIKAQVALASSNDQGGRNG